MPPGIWLSTEISDEAEIVGVADEKQLERDELRQLRVLCVTRKLRRL
jgi:hypothetical protein